MTIVETWRSCDCDVIDEPHEVHEAWVCSTCGRPCTPRTTVQPPVWMVTSRRAELTVTKPKRRERWSVSQAFAEALVRSGSIPDVMDLVKEASLADPDGVGIDRVPGAVVVDFDLARSGMRELAFSLVPVLAAVAAAGDGSAQLG